MPLSAIRLNAFAPMGCGKSTMLRMIAGLEEITQGTVAISDTLVNDVAPSKGSVAMVFQTYGLYPHMTVYKNMSFSLKQAKTPAAEIDRCVRAAAEVLQIDDYLDRSPKHLSGSRRQRVAIGRAIVRDPQIFLFDEPLSNLDAALRVQTRLEIARLHERLKSWCCATVRSNRLAHRCNYIRPLRTLLSRSLSAALR